MPERLLSHKIIIGVAIYNEGPYILQTLESLCDQTYPISGYLFPIMLQRMVLEISVVIFAKKIIDFRMYAIVKTWGLTTVLTIS